MTTTVPAVAGRQATVPCKVCAGSSTYLLSVRNGGDPDSLDVFVCGSCGLVFIGTPISHAQLAQAYGRADAQHYYEDIATATDAKVSGVVEEVVARLSAADDAAAVLDVGCGYGHFLTALRERLPNVRAVGHELPGESAAACRRRGLEILTCPLEEIGDRFSVITLLDVAEHVPEPTETFSTCHSLLTDGGYLYIHTPRRCFWDEVFIALAALPALRPLAGAWLRTRVSIAHLQLWSDRSLALALRHAGFEVLYLKRTLELSWPVEQYAQVYLGEKLRLPPPLVSAAAAVANLLFVRLGALRNKAICLAQKPPA